MLYAVDNLIIYVYNYIRMIELCQYVLRFLTNDQFSIMHGVNMIKNKRQEEIIEILKKDGFATVRHLGDRLFASQPTVRRDLDYLEKEGLVHRSHGGAILAGDKINTPVSFRQKKRYREKLRIARLASELIERDLVVFTDASTTALCLSDFIEKKDGVTVVTNGLPMCQTLAKGDITVYSTGGRLYGESMAFVGGVAERAALHFNADIMFFSASSFDDSGQITDYSESETSLRIAMLSKSRVKVFLFDSSKFGSRSAFSVCSADDIDYIVADMPLDEGMAKRISFSLQKESDGAYLYKKI